jgi:hypothetical protein
MIFFLKAMKRMYESGAQKRKKLKIKEAELKKQQNSLQHFISIKSREESQNDTRVIATEENSADITPSLSPDDVIDDNSFGITQEDNTNNGTTTALSDIINDTPYMTKHQTYSEDIALWLKPIMNDFTEFCLHEKLQNVCNIKNSKIDFNVGGKIVTRKLNESHLYLTRANGTQGKRESLIFSETT